MGCVGLSVMKYRRPEAEAPRMRFPRVRLTVRQMMLAVAASAGSLVLGSGSDVQYLSCHLCHNREQIDSVTLWFVPIIWHRSVTTDFPAEAGHVTCVAQYSENTDSFLDRTLPILPYACLCGREHGPRRPPIEMMSLTAPQCGDRSD